MQQGYPPVQYAGQQGMYTDPAGYPIQQQSPGMMGYPPQQAMPQAAYPPQPGMYQPMMGQPPMMGAPAPAYPPAAGAPAPGMGMGVGTGAMGFDDPYAYAQQYGMSREEVDSSMAAYRELTTDMDRGMLNAFGLGTAQKLLQRVFGSAGNEQMVAVLVGVLGTALASGRMPNIKDFISIMGQYKMNSLGQSFGGKLFGNPQMGGQQYAGLGPMGAGYGQAGMNQTGGGLGAMMSSILGDHEHGKKHKDKKKKK